jgi:ferritin
MLSKTLHDAINTQIKHELNSAYLYLSMSAHCETLNLPGCARWLRIQWQEEVAHAMKLFDLIGSRGGKVTLQALDQPPAEFKSVRDIFERVLVHEQKVTTWINQLYALAVKENDYAAQADLQWFVKEQVEEEQTTTTIVAQLEMIGDSGTALMMLDRHLGTRAVAN